MCTSNVSWLRAALRTRATESRYSVVLSPAAQRQLARTRGSATLALRGVILALEEEPRPPGIIKLSGGTGLWRIRIRIDGRAWRIVVQIDDRARTVVVTRVAQRDEGTYRGL